MKYFLSVLFIVTSLNVSAGPQHTDVTVEAGVVNQDIDINDTPAPEPVLAPLNVPVEEQHVICDVKCQASEPVQLPNQSVITTGSPAVPADMSNQQGPPAAASSADMSNQQAAPIQLKKKPVNRQAKAPVPDKSKQVKKVKEPTKANAKKKPEPVVECTPIKHKK